MIEDAKRGNWPLGNGPLNETQAFFDAYKIFLNSKSLLQTKQK